LINDGLILLFWAPPPAIKKILGGQAVGLLQAPLRSGFFSAKETGAKKN
jgi:hypothetical protein